MPELVLDGDDDDDGISVFRRGNLAVLNVGQFSPPDREARNITSRTCGIISRSSRDSIVLSTATAIKYAHFATLLWHAAPSSIDNVDHLFLVHACDRRKTPVASEENQ